MEGTNSYRLIFGFSSILLLIVLQLYIIKKVLPNAGSTKKIYTLDKGATFLIAHKQLIYIHLQVWLMVIWFIGYIFLFESAKADISEVTSEWKYFLLFVLCFFFIIDLFLHFYLARAYFYISTKEINYRFNIRKHHLPVEWINSITQNPKTLSYQITMNDGRTYDISYSPGGALTFLADSDKCRKLLDELGGIVSGT